MAMVIPSKIDARNYASVELIQMLSSPRKGGTAIARPAFNDVL